MLLAFIVDTVVWYKSSHIKLDEDDGGENVKDKTHNALDDEEWRKRLDCYWTVIPAIIIILD